MKKFFEEIRGARNIEWCLIALAIALLFLSQLNTDSAAVLPQTDQEQRLSAILCRIDGVGKAEAMISEDGGVLVVAEGAQDLSVYLRLQYAVRTLLGADCSRIEIVPYQK